MANGAIVPLQGIWRGSTEFSGVRRQAALEVFPSGEAWVMLFGKALLEGFNMVHEYATNIIVLPTLEGTTVHIPNQ